MKNILQRFFKPSKEYRRLYNVDLHSHLIPGIDDGAQTIEDSLLLLKGIEKLGFEKIITTPHIMSHRFLNDSSIINSGLTELKKRAENENITLTIEAAAEYYMDEHFFQLLEKKEILSFGENYLLFEHNYGIKPQNYESLVFEIAVAGYKPVLAHPERYLFMHKDFKNYERLKEQGVYLQLNLNSLSGYYSKPVQRVAKQLIDRGLIDFIGSDMHHQKHLQNFQNNINSTLIADIFKKNTILNDQLL
jgi:tyrosine-protein phosphatase YwqE